MTMIDLISMICGSLVALIFIRAAVHKFSSWEENKAIVGEYNILPRRLVPPIASVLPFAEIVFAFMMLMPSPYRVVAGSGAILFLLVYATGIALNLKRGRTNIDCGCGGGGTGITWWHVARNVIFSFLALVAMNHDPFLSGRAIDAGTIISGVGCVGVLWLLVLLYEQILNNHIHIMSTIFSSRY